MNAIDLLIVVGIVLGVVILYQSIKYGCERSPSSEDPTYQDSDEEWGTF